MQSPLDASASTVGALFSNSTFEVPQYQREYSWQTDEVTEFWNDLRNNLDSDSYFLGLIILTAEEQRKHVVDGQQRIVTLTLLANAIYHEAVNRGRRALADRIRADFLRSIDFETDETDPRVILSDQADNQTIQQILDTGEAPEVIQDEDSASHRIAESYKLLKSALAVDIESDPFKRLGKWTEFLANRVYLAVFVHPDAATAYQVFEVINTRGRDLTTADLLKNYILSQTAPLDREERYQHWRSMARSFAIEGANNTFVQFIRHAVTVQSGHILPKSLFGFLAGREKHPNKTPPTPNQLVEILDEYYPLYLQMVDPTLSGPADENALRVFSALNDINVMTVRPILLALSGQPDSEQGFDYILRLVVRRIIVGSLGTGNIERRFSEAARLVYKQGSWIVLKENLEDLNPTREEFVGRIRKRPFSKNVLTFVQRSILQDSVTPDPEGILHFIWPKNAESWSNEEGEEEEAEWVATIGNTFLSKLHKRPKEASLDWRSFKENMLNHEVANEWTNKLRQHEKWTSADIRQVGDELAEAAGAVWYGE